MVVPGLALGLMLVRRRGWLPLLGWLGAIIGSVLLDVIVKHFLSREHMMAGLGAPSGQALEALVGYGMVGYFIALASPGRRATAAAVAALTLLVLAICFGRLYLGTRYFSDIVSGLAAGGVWLAACITGLEVARRRSERERRGGLDRREARVVFGE
jgi:undecaprenyl-diphosphatase